MNNITNPNAFRGSIVARRTYQRPKQRGGFESWNELVDRVINHQKYLWERQLGRNLNQKERSELVLLGNLIREKKALLAGRTLWLGGTETSKRRHISNFNCSYISIKTVNDVVDAFWLLLNGSGVGFKPIPGLLNGFKKPINDVVVINTTKGPDEKGREENVETFEDGVWTIKVGDSGEAWAKSIGKLLAGKYQADKLVLDFSEVRGAGGRLAGYGWISSGDKVISQVYPKIAKLLSNRAGRLLDEIDILDIINYLGVIQTGRRGAEIALLDYGNRNWQRFATAKKDFWLYDNHHRTQSNNSLMFNERPSSFVLGQVLEMMWESGGSEPGIINAKEMKRRAPWAEGVNPCAEILLADKGVCNLVEVDLNAFDRWVDLEQAVYLIARANYRQTLVDFKDGILQDSWHQANEFLRLCGVSLTGWALVENKISDHDIKRLKNLAVTGAYSMAMELGTELPKNVTTIKPSGSVSKVMGTTEGVHRPLGRFIFNNITFSKHEPIVEVLRNHGYNVFDNPSQPDGVVVTFPIRWDALAGGTQSALEQLNNYKRTMLNWTEQNTSVTISYDESELEDIQDWLIDNWDNYVGVSFIKRTDPTKSAKDLGYLYLPQEVVDESRFNDYLSRLKPIDEELLFDTGGIEDVDFLDDGCEGGVCPVR